MTDDPLAREMAEWESADLSVPLDAAPSDADDWDYDLDVVANMRLRDARAAHLTVRIKEPCRPDPVDLGLVPNATANAMAADVELADMVAIVPRTCRACVQWEPWHGAYGEERPAFGTCLYLSGLRNPLDTMWLLNNPNARTLPDFGCNRWRAKEAPQ